MPDKRLPCDTKAVAFFRGWRNGPQLFTCVAVANNNQRQHSVRHRQSASVNFLTVIALLAVVLLTSIVLPQLLGRLSPDDSLESVANASTAQTQQNNHQGTKLSRIHNVQINKPSGPPTVDTGLKDFHGNPVTTSCSTCHTTRQPDFKNKTTADLDEFHKLMHFSHGAVSCLSCHNSNDYDALKLADGTRVEFIDVMTLCAQCHGPQMRDFEHGAHGGMNGFWDLKYGPQVKNNCVDCHNPHTPQFPKMNPTFKPKDRFLDKEH